jgi:hypothetical protein
VISFRPSLAHLARMTDDTGVFEHALGAIPRRDNGWCTDDNGRALAVVSRSQDAAAPALAPTYLAFLVHAHEGGGRFHLRMSYDRQWTADPMSDDANGRALFGLAVAAARGPEALRWSAGRLFDEAAAFRSEHPRATAHAAVAAAELIAADPEHPAAWALLSDAAAALPRPVNDPAWLWPFRRLTYANALIPEALLAVGSALQDDLLIADGLRLLSWLVDEETRQGHFSFVPTGGRGPGEPRRPAFDQQAIEASSMAEACARAFDVTEDAKWLEPLARAADWFRGANDAGTPMVDPATGGGFDGLERGGVNRNQGAESTLAAISTLQQAERLVPRARMAGLHQVDQASAVSAFRS